MRTHKRMAWAGLLALVVFTTRPLRADEPVAGPKGAGEKLPAALPAEVHGNGNGSAHVGGHGNGGHGGEHEEVETGPLSGIFVEGEYLLIKARRQALDFAIITPNRNVLPSGNVLSADWGTDNGFRVGAGYRLPGDGWALGAFVTGFHASDTRAVSAPAGGALLATITQGGGIEDVGTAFATTDLDFTVVDLEASKHLCVGDSFGLKFFGGGRLAFIDQQFSTIYTGGNLGANNPLLVNSPIYFRGAGLTGGGEGTWKISNGWGLYGRARVSLVSGQFTQSLTETLTAGNVVVAHVSEKYKAVIPVGELGAGVCYQGEHFSMKVGYDLANWFNMVDSLDFPDSTSFGHLGRRQSDLTLEALSVQLGVVF